MAEDTTVKAWSALRGTVKLSAAEPLRARAVDALRIRPLITTLPATPAPAPGPIPAPAPALPPAPASNPFEVLPMPSPGDRIKAEDFRALSQALHIIYASSVLSATLFGRTFADAKLLLAGQQYQVERVMTVLGTDVTDPGDESLDDRRVVQVLPSVLGERDVLLVLTEAVDQRRYVPDLTQAATFKDAMAILHDRIGPAPVSATPVVTPDLVGRTLADLHRISGY